CSDPTHGETARQRLQALSTAPFSKPGRARKPSTPTDTHRSRTQMGAGGRRRAATAATSGHAARHQGDAMSSPEQWTRPQSGAGSAATAAQPSPEQVIAGLQATTEGGAELTQLLNPEGERLPSPEFDPYVADIDAEALRGLYRD